MSFTVNDFSDLTRLLAERPEWRAELRRLVLTDDILELPAIVRELAEAQRRTEQRVEELAEAQRRTEERLDALTKRVEELAEAQRRTEETLREVIKRLDAFAAWQSRADDDFAMLIGEMLERRYRDRAHGYFSRVLRKIRIPSWEEVEKLAEPLTAAGALTEEELRDLLLADVIVRGQLKQGTSDQTVWLVVEVSRVVDREDVERAWRRAELLHKCGVIAVSGVAGDALTKGAEAWLSDRPTFALLDGKIRAWEEALAAALQRSRPNQT